MLQQIHLIIKEGRAPFWPVVVFFLLGFMFGSLQFVDHYFMVTAYVCGTLAIGYFVLALGTYWLYRGWAWIKSRRK